MTAAYGHQTHPHILEYMSIVFWKFIKIFSPRFGGRDKKEKQKKSGNMGFKEFPRPLINENGGAVQHFIAMP